MKSAVSAVNTIRTHFARSSYDPAYRLSVLTEQSFPGKEDACPTSWMGVRTSRRSAAPLCGSPSLNLRTIADSKCPGQKMINAASCAIEWDEHDKISPYVDVGGRMTHAYCLLISFA